MKFPLAPLASYLRSIWRQETAGREQLIAFGASTIADMCGVTPRSVHRWAHNGLSWLMADAVAIRLGLHPCLIWGEDWWVLDEPAA